MKRLVKGVLILVFIFTGCTPIYRMAEPATDTPSIVDNTSSGEEQFFLQAARGRYVEQVITPPQAADYISGIWLTNSGVVCDSNGLYISADCGNTWTEVDTGWMDQLEHDYVSVLFVAEDGAIWATAKGQNEFEIYLYQIGPDGKLRQITVEETLMGINILRSLPDNRFLMLYHVPIEREWDASGGVAVEARLAVFDSFSGQRLYTIEPAFPESMGYVTSHGEYIYYVEATHAESANLSIAVIQAEDGSLLDRYIDIIPADIQSQSILHMARVIANDNGFYYVNSQGLNRVGFAGSLTEVVLEAGRYSFQRLGMESMCYLAAPDNTFYLISSSVEYNPVQPDILYRYAYDSNAPFFEDAGSPETPVYYLAVNEDGGRTLYMATPEGESTLLVEGIHYVEAENSQCIVFTRLETGQQRSTESLHYYHKETGAVTDIFTDGWISDWEAPATSGYALGAWASGGGGAKDWVTEHPNYAWVGGKLRVYISRIEENETDVYYYNFSTDLLELQQTIDWNGFNPNLR